MGCFVAIPFPLRFGQYRVTHEKIDEVTCKFFTYGFTITELFENNHTFTIESMQNRMRLEETSDALLDMCTLIYKLSGSNRLPVVKRNPGIFNKTSILGAYWITAFPDKIFPNVMSSAEVILFNASCEFVLVIHQLAYIMRNLRIRKVELAETEIGYTTEVVVDTFLRAWYNWSNSTTTDKLTALIHLVDNEITVNV